MKVLARMLNKSGGIVEIVSYNPSIKGRVMALYKKGYPDSFDEFDLVAIERDLDASNPCLIAKKGKKLVGAVQFSKWPAIQDGWILSYFFVAEKGAGIGEMLCAVMEETLKKEARLIFTTHAGVLPDYVSSYGFFPKMGYKEWGVLPGYFRDDLWGIFFAKRNPYYPIGKGIPRNSGWCKEMIDEKTGKHILREEYRALKHGLEPVQKASWGFNLIGRERIKENNL